jgi:hypothetical protein
MRDRWGKTRLTPVSLAGLLAATFILVQYALGYFWAGSGSLVFCIGFTSGALRSNCKAFSIYPLNSFDQYISGFTFLGMAEHVRARQMVCDFLIKAFRYLQESIALNPLGAHTWPELVSATGWLSHSCKSGEITLPSYFFDNTKRV